MGAPRRKPEPKHYTVWHYDALRGKGKLVTYSKATGEAVRSGKSKG